MQTWRERRHGVPLCQRHGLSHPLISQAWRAWWVSAQTGAARRAGDPYSSVWRIAANKTAASGAGRERP